MYFKCVWPRRDNSGPPGLTARHQTNSISDRKMPLSFSTCTTFVVCLAVLAGGAIGTSNGMVLYVDGDGRLTIESPHFRHTHSHAEAADHEPHDYGGEADHADLHDLIGSCSDSFINFQKLERSSSSLMAVQHHLAGFDFCLSACLASGIHPLLARDGLGIPTFRGGTAHFELACLRCVVLLV
jgi:hypothetical protein